MAKLKALRSSLGTLSPRLASLPSGSWRTSSQSSTQRGYDYRWQKARAEHLRLHPHCVYCLRDAGIQASDPAGVVIECAERGVPVPCGNVVDHKIPHRGDKALFWDRSNWQTLCSTHHSGAKQREERQDE
ncbi:HNH endonuclease [Pigmentiphaga kullae]|uniref:HNH endonuclease n=1 Tax=Pigmentiphaga kullae TaxID=151784 RepID=A0A4V2F2Z8_9BURK|nr:HNH endonuclease [Pigmentiphaga kullae]RZS80644.1 hypothetical protein EV675_3256 [Pigmentiphaga kullae]